MSAVGVKYISPIFNIPLSVRIAMIQAVKDMELTKMGKLADSLDTKSVK